MPQIPIRKVKRAIVLTKRTQALRKYYRERSYRPMYEKLKTNNNYLAKALSHEKENNQSLFAQNLALLAELQELRLGCNTRDNVITNVLSNAKEMLKMLVTMSGYMTNTISICQEYITSDTAARLSIAPTGRKDSSKRLSTKSPAKGVVKPMVSGHTITKPTINLSRVNIGNINNQNINRLSDIPEVTPPSRSSINRSQLSEDGPSVSIAITPLRYENSPTRRMPERLAVSSLDDTLVTNDERRRRKNRRSKKLSGTFSRSRSNRWPNETPRRSMEHISQVGSPTVKLNDVSKLLQNSHSINIRRLINNVNIRENGSNAHNDIPDKNIMSETRVSIDLDEDYEDDEASGAISSRKTTIQTASKIAEHSSVTESLRPNSIWVEDPLEGPSWLFDNALPTPLRDNEPEESPEESSQSRDSDFNNNTSNVIEYDNDDDDDDDASSIIANNVEESPLNLGNLMEQTDASILERDATTVPEDINFESYSNNPDADSSVCAIFKTEGSSASERNSDNTDKKSMNLASFVTFRRGSSEAVNEQTEEFTLLLTRQPIRNVHFDINELRLPTPQECTMNSRIDESSVKETIAMPNLTNCSVSNVSSNQDQIIGSEYDQSMDDDHESTSTSEKNRQTNKKNKKTESSKDRTEHAESDCRVDSRAKSRSKSKKNRDPSAAKVVLEKLKESRVKQKAPTADDKENLTNHTAIRNDTCNHQMESLESTENVTNDDHNLNRPKRRKAPVNLKEPSLVKKLRRNK